MKWAHVEIICEALVIIGIIGLMYAAGVTIIEAAERSHRVAKEVTQCVTSKHGCPK